MTHSQTRALLCCIALLIVAACKQANDSSKSPTTNAQSTSAALREQSASKKAAEENAKRVRVQELTTLISVAQTQRDDLVQRKSKIEAELAAYQADSTATLVRLKAEMQALQRQKDKTAAMSGKQSSTKQMDDFNERARNQLEHALAMDQEYQAQLKLANNDIGSIDESIATMRAEEKSLHAEIRN